VGTRIGVTPRIEANEAVLAEVDVQLSRLEPMLKADADDPVASQRTTVVSAQSTLRIEKGRGVVMTASQSAGNEESREMLIVVSARVESSDAEPEKAAAAPVEELRVFALQHASAEAIAKTLQKVFVDRNLQLAPEARTNNLIVRGGPQQLQEIEALLQRMDRGE
jgi:type II secretory pathway component GspD/PulD (secretin)